MVRKKSLIILPKLKDAGGDISKKWYVEYSCRNPHTDKMERFRHYEGFDELLTAEERYAYAEKIINQLLEKLSKGLPYEEEKKTYQDELIYKQVADRWGMKKEGVVTIRTYLSEFLSMKKASVNSKSYQTYQSKCRIFCEWAEMRKIDIKHVSLITQEIICEHLTYLANERNLSRLSIEKYAQILRTFFDYLLKQKKVITENPVHNIPKLGRVVDDAPRPIPDSLRKKLIKAIQVIDPQLYLVCQFEYYCAIRPNECRLMRISDIDFDNQLIRVRNEISKNSRTETVSIPDQLYKQLEELHLSSWQNPEDYIFSNHGMPGPIPLGKNNFRNRFNSIRNHLNLPKSFKLYSFKHTGSVKLVGAGVDPWQLQQHMRHKSITTTENYIKNRLGVQSDKIKKHFPDI